MDAYANRQLQAVLLPELVIQHRHVFNDGWPSPDRPLSDELPLDLNRQPILVSQSVGLKSSGVSPELLTSLGEASRGSFKALLHEHI